jgi:membrane protein involved in colicin uptake
MTQEGAPDCVASFVTRTRDVAHVKMTAKAERLRQKAAQDQQAKQKSAAAQKALLKEQQKARAQAKAQAQEQAKALAQAQAEQAALDNQISALRPDFDDAVARLSSTNDFWNNLSRQLASSGQSLRSSVRTALNSANSDGNRCQEFLSQSKVDELKTCISKINSDLDKLDKFK